MYSLITKQRGIYYRTSLYRGCSAAVPALLPLCKIDYVHTISVM